MTSALRPMSTGEVLDRTFHLYRNHFRLFAGIGSGFGLCVLIGALILVLFGKGQLWGPATLYLAELVIALFALAGYAVAAGPTCYAVSKVNFAQTATIRESYDAVRSLVLRALRIVFSIFLRCFGAFLLPALLIVAVGAVIPWLAQSMGSLPAIVGVVWAMRIFCRNSLAIPVCLLERSPARHALKRSGWLTSNALGRVFLVFLLTGLLGAALFYAFLIPGMMAAGKVPISVITGWQSLAVFAAMTLSFPIGTIATTLLYYDLRVRKEAFDLQLMMESLGQSAPERTFAS